MIAVIKPEVPPEPVVIPKANARGSATIPTVVPAIKSLRQDFLNPLKSLRVGKKSFIIR